MLTTVAAAPAAEFYVDARNSTGTELGTQQSPFRMVQAAIDAAASGDEIRVAAGTYIENLRIEGKGIVLEGGYSIGWVRDLAANTTTLSGAGANAVINLIEADSTIDGFHITGGTGSIEELPYSYRGGGIYSRDGSPTISNNTIEGNDIRSTNPPSDYNLGGGVYVANAPTATIVNNVVRGNYAGRGAGIAVFGQAAQGQRILRPEFSMLGIC
jgi:nitrous oxidase accessory protein NosD